MLPSTPTRPASFRLLCLLVGVAVSAAGGDARADLVLTFSPGLVAPGGTGFVDVFVTGTSATADPVAGYQFGLDLAPVGAANGLSFSGTVTRDTAAADGYLFPGATGGFAFPPATATPQSLDYGDTDPLFTPTNVAEGDLFGAGRFFLDATALAAGDYVVTVDPVTSGFFRNDLTDIAFTATPGTITVAGPAPVPEPSTLLLLFGAGAVGLVRRRRTAA